MQYFPNISVWAQFKILQQWLEPAASLCGGGGESSSLELCGGRVKTKYLKSNIFQFSCVCFCSQRRTHPVMVCLGKAQDLRMWQNSLPLPLPQKSAYWSFHPRFRLILQQKCSTSGSLRSGPACRPCLRYRWTQWWGAQIRKGGLSSLTNWQNKKAHLQKSRLHSPHFHLLLHLHLYHSLTRWQMRKAPPRWHQTLLLPQASCLHPLGKMVLRCLQSLNQNCEYSTGPFVSVAWGGGGCRLTTREGWEARLRPSGSDREVNPWTKAFPLRLCCISAASCLPQWVCWLLPVCGCKQICVGFAGWLQLCPSDTRLYVQPRTGPPRTDVNVTEICVVLSISCREACTVCFTFMSWVPAWLSSSFSTFFPHSKKNKKIKNMHNRLAKALNCVGVCVSEHCVSLTAVQQTWTCSKELWSWTVWSVMSAKVFS